MPSSVSSSLKLLALPAPRRWIASGVFYQWYGVEYCGLVFIWCLVFQPIASVENWSQPQRTLHESPVRMTAFHHLHNGIRQI
jgi:hypothetical protein